MGAGRLASEPHTWYTWQSVSCTHAVSAAAGLSAFKCRSAPGHLVSVVALHQPRAGEGGGRRGGEGGVVHPGPAGDGRLCKWSSARLLNRCHFKAHHKNLAELSASDQTCCAFGRFQTSPVKPQQRRDKILENIKVEKAAPPAAGSCCLQD